MNFHWTYQILNMLRLLIARHVQRSIFGKIYTKLSLDAEIYARAVSQIQNTQLKCEMKKLANLKRFLDSNGILHVHGRLSKTKINCKQKHQIILPWRHHFTHLIIQFYHEMAGHSGPDATVGSTHTAYWISSGIHTVKHYLRSWPFLATLDAGILVELTETTQRNTEKMTIQSRWFSSDVQSTFSTCTVPTCTHYYYAPRLFRCHV